MFHHASKLGAQGIVSKRLGPRYPSGRSPDWLKFKNPKAPVVEAEEDCGKTVYDNRPNCEEKSSHQSDAH